MAWSEVLNTLLGMRQLSQNKISDSRNRQLGLMDRQFQARQYQDEKMKNLFEPLKEPLKRLQTQQFQAGEAEKSRQFSSKEAEKSRQFQKEESEAAREFNREAQKDNYTYDYTYQHPWSGKTIDLIGDGTIGQHEINTARLREFISAQNLLMKDALRDDVQDSRDEWTLSSVADEIRQAITQRAGGFFDPTTGMPLIGEYGTYEDWEKALFDQYSQVVDDLVNDAVRRYPEIDEQALRRAIFYQMREQQPSELEVPGVSEKTEERGEFGPLWRPGLGADIMEGLRNFGGRVGDALSGAGVTETPTERQETIEEIDNNDITGMGAAFDIARQLQNIQASQSQDIQGIWENEILRTIGRIEDKASPTDLNRLQQIYDLIAGKGKWESAGQSRSDWKSLLDEVQALASKYGG